MPAVIRASLHEDVLKGKAIRCISPSEAAALLGHQGFSVSLEQEAYRSALVLEQAYASRQHRIAAEQPPQVGLISSFVLSVNNWLPADQGRVFWADRWEPGSFGGRENALVALAWRGVGDGRTLREAPGMVFDREDWNEEDQLRITASHAEALGVIIGLVTLLMMTLSDGWLVSTGSTDRVEFWEGNFFLHSADEEQLRRGHAIVKAYGCKRWKTSY